jgi:predicted RNA binding protein YcfA (HicA-like mRNA interferase family)
VLTDRAPDVKSGALAIPLAGGTSTVAKMCSIPLVLTAVSTCVLTPHEVSRYSVYLIRLNGVYLSRLVFMSTEVPRRQIVKELRDAGFVLARTTGPHDWWKHPSGKGVAVPRHQNITPGVVGKIRKAIGETRSPWTDI